MFAGMKVSRRETAYVCVNEREARGTERLQEVEMVLRSLNNGECNKELKKRVQAGWSGWRNVSGVIKAETRH